MKHVEEQTMRDYLTDHLVIEHDESRIELAKLSLKGLAERHLKKHGWEWPRDAR